MYWTDPTLYGATLPRRDIPFTPPFTPPFMNQQFMQHLPWQGMIPPFLPFQQNVAQQLPWQGAQRFLPPQKNFGYNMPFFGQGIGYETPYMKQDMGYKLPYIPQEFGYKFPFVPQEFGYKLPYVPQEFGYETPFYGAHNVNVPFYGWQNPWVG